MAHSGTWSPYGGSSSLVLAFGLCVVVGLVLYAARCLPHPIAAKRPGKGMGIALVLLWAVAVSTFVVAASIYVWALLQQVGYVTSPENPITIVTVISAVVAFVLIVALTWRGGVRVAVGSALVGTIAAPCLFELPFDLIVMWRTFPPAPHVLFTLLFFLPLFLVEGLSFALLTLSPVMRVSRFTLLCVAAMFAIFAVWAIAAGFAYPASLVPIALNRLAKVVAFAAAVSLFLPQVAEASQTQNTGQRATQQRGASRSEVIWRCVQAGAGW